MCERRELPSPAALRSCTSRSRGLLWVVLEPWSANLGRPLGISQPPLVADRPQCYPDLTLKSVCWSTLDGHFRPLAIDWFRVARRPFQACTGIQFIARCLLTKPKSASADGAGTQ